MNEPNSNSDQAPQVIIKEKADISSANGKIVVKGKGFHKKVHVVYFTENQADKILKAVDRINTASNAEA